MREPQGLRTQSLSGLVIFNELNEDRRTLLMVSSKYWFCIATLKRRHDALETALLDVLSGTQPSRDTIATLDLSFSATTEKRQRFLPDTQHSPDGGL